MKIGFQKFTIETELQINMYNIIDSLYTFLDSTNHSFIVYLEKFNERNFDYF